MADTRELEAKLRDQEARLVFSQFDEDVAWEIGTRLVEKAKAKNAPVAINIRTPVRTLFHASMPGASAENDIWARRKSNMVFHKDMSSYLVGVLFDRQGIGATEFRGLDPMDYTKEGGSFPVRVGGITAAAITISGLSSEDDHGLIVEVLEEMLG